MFLVDFAYHKIRTEVLENSHVIATEYLLFFFIIILTFCVGLTMTYKFLYVEMLVQEIIEGENKRFIGIVLRNLPTVAII